MSNHISDPASFLITSSLIALTDDVAEVFICLTPTGTETIKPNKMKWSWVLPAHSVHNICVINILIF